MKMKKRLLSILLSLALVLGLLPGMSLTAYAADATETIATATEGTTTYTGSHFKVEGTRCHSVSGAENLGLYISIDYGNQPIQTHTVTISSLNGKTIKKIEGNIVYNYDNAKNKLSTNHGSISVSGGKWSGTLTVDNVNAESVKN